jgi:hypothetical protein
MAQDTARIKLLMDMDDKASSKLKTVGKNADKFRERVDRMRPAFKKMAVAGVAAFAALAGAVMVSVKAYQVQERAEKRLEQLTRQTSNATDEQIQSLKNQAAALQQVGVVGDEVTMFGQSQLATFALQTSTIETLTPALLDLAVATKGVNATQEDMINIGNLVGKVMGGQIGALGRLGITFSDAQAEILKTGNEMERAATLADVLAGNFGGLNAAMRETTEGQIQAMKNSFGDLQESIGGVFAPVLADLAERLIPIIDRAAEWVKQNPELIKQIVMVTAGVAAFVAVLGALSLILLTLNPISIMITLAIGAIGLIIYSLNNAIKMFGGSWKGVWEGIKDVTKTVIDAMISFFNPFESRLAKVIGLLQKMWSLIQDTGIGKAVTGMFGGGRASGGPVSGGTTYMVGEQGPELFTPNSNGSIIPNGSLAAVGGGGSTYNLNFRGATFMGRNAAREIGDGVMTELMKREKLRQ